MISAHAAGAALSLYVVIGVFVTAVVYLATWWVQRQVQKQNLVNLVPHLLHMLSMIENSNLPFVTFVFIVSWPLVVFLLTRGLIEGENNK